MFLFLKRGLHDADKCKPLWPGQRRRKIPNPFTCTAPFFMKRPIKDSVYDREDRIRTYCFTPQLCDRAEKANRNQGQPCVPFMQIV